MQKLFLLMVLVCLGSACASRPANTPLAAFTPGCGHYDAPLIDAIDPPGWRHERESQLPCAGVGGYVLSYAPAGRTSDDLVTVYARKTESDSRAHFIEQVNFNLRLGCEIDVLVEGKDGSAPRYAEFICSVGNVGPVERRFLRAYPVSAEIEIIQRAYFVEPTDPKKVSRAFAHLQKWTMVVGEEQKRLAACQ